MHATADDIADWTAYLIHSKHKVSLDEWLRRRAH